LLIYKKLYKIIFTLRKRWKNVKKNKYHYSSL
jgi:hypothetical protein